MIPKLTMLKLQKHEYLDREFYESLRIEECKFQYQVFEKVFKSIAKKHNIGWRHIYRAEAKNSQSFLLLCICLIIIDKALRFEFRLPIVDRESLLLDRNNQIVRDYYRYI